MAEYGIVRLCDIEIDFKDVDEKLRVCAQRFNSVQMVGTYQSAASPCTRNME